MRVTKADLLVRTDSLRFHAIRTMASDTAIHWLGGTTTTMLALKLGYDWGITTKSSRST